MSISAVPKEESNKYLVLWIIPSQIYEKNDLNFDPSITKLQGQMYSRCAHCKQNIFYKSKCCWTFRTVTTRRSKRFNENTLTFSHSTVRIKLKFL